MTVASVSHQRVPAQRTAALTLGALALLVVTLAAVTILTSLDVSQSSKRANADLALSVSYQAIRAAIADEGSAVQAYRDGRDGARLRLTGAQARLRGGVAELRRRGTGADRAIAPYIAADELRYRWASRALFAAVDADDRATAQRISAMELAPAFTNIQRLVDLAARVHHDQALEATSSVSRRSTRFASVVSLAYVGGFVLLAACAFYLLRLQAALRQLAVSQHRLARHDALTGLPNRLMWHESAALRMAAEESAAVLLIDLNAFKHVNDTLGHDQGDALLKVVAHRLLGEVRTDDVVARIGGDEFAVLLRGTDEPGAVAVAAKLAAALQAPCRMLGLDLRPTGSIGIAVAPTHGTDIDTLLKHADRAMYSAKKARSGPVVYSPPAPDGGPLTFSWDG